MVYDNLRKTELHYVTFTFTRTIRYPSFYNYNYTKENQINNVTYPLCRSIFPRKMLLFLSAEYIVITSYKKFSILCSLSMTVPIIGSAHLSCIRKKKHFRHNKMCLSILSSPTSQHKQYFSQRLYIFHNLGKTEFRLVHVNYHQLQNIV